MTFFARPLGAPVIRHIAITFAALIAWALHDELRVGNGVLLLLGTVAIVNLAGYLGLRRPVLGLVFERASPFFGVAGWAALIAMTGGEHSPFVAGLSLEIVLSAMTFQTAGIVLVTVTAAGALWVVQAIAGLGELAMPMSLQTGFLLAIGAMTILLSLGSAQRQRTLSKESEDLGERLRRAEGDLEEVRKVGEVGENAARLAHSYKNATHTLRGFASLLEFEAEEKRLDPEAVKGLMTAIDRLDELARATLDPETARGSHSAVCSGADLHRTIDEVTREISASHPEICCGVQASGETPPAVVATPAILREVLLALLWNAVEAMQGRGQLEVETRPAGDRFQILVRDHGCGLQPSTLSGIFSPGVTTKPGGSGYGLYLARRLVEAQGGELTAMPAASGGAQFSVTLTAARS